MLATMPATDEDKPKRIITQVRVEPDLWERIKEQARRKRMSANSYLLYAAERALHTDENLHD